MTHIISEGNKDLKNRKFMLPNGIRKHLYKTLENYNGDKTVNGYKRLSNILSAKTLSYSEMKRVKNFFDNYSGTDKSAEYILNGGEPMKSWVNSTLNTATASIRNFKQALKDSGVKNAFRKPHEKDRQKKIKKPAMAKIQTTNLSQRLQNNDSIRLERIERISEADIHVFDNFLSEYGIDYVIEQFSNSGGRGKLRWLPLINPQMYKKALDEYIKFGRLIRFPVKHVYQWMNIIMKNTALLYVCTTIYGHTEYCPYNDIIYGLSEILEERYGEYRVKDNNIELENGKKIDFDTLFDEIGLYDFLRLPDGSPACTDYGLSPIFKLIDEYECKNNGAAECALVTINKILDIYHCNGDLSSAFIVGGRKSCTNISEALVQKTIYISQNQTRDIIKKLNKLII